MDTPPTASTCHSTSKRLHVAVHVSSGSISTLGPDVLAGLTGSPKRLPPKYFYDDEGSRLFDQICDTREYYQTRTEQALLEELSGGLLAERLPTDLVELGSGAARKTCTLLDAASRLGLRPRYVPFDVCEDMLRRSAETLLNTYPWLHIHGVVGDYDRHLDRLPPGDRRLILFLGGTIGNFTAGEARDFLARIAARMGPGDRLLLGTDLVKEPALLHAAYNDAQGITASFNKNVLQVINRELDGEFDLDSFKHLAFFDEGSSQIEMHLQATEDFSVHIGKLDISVDFIEGETIHTEISRKFTRESVADLYGQAGLEMVSWHTPANGWFGLSVARRQEG